MLDCHPARCIASAESTPWTCREYVQANFGAIQWVDETSQSALYPILVCIEGVRVPL